MGLYTGYYYMHIKSLLETLGFGHLWENKIFKQNYDLT